MTERYILTVTENAFRPPSGEDPEKRKWYIKLNNALQEKALEWADTFGLEIEGINPYNAQEFAEDFLNAQLKNRNFDLMLFFIDEIRTWMLDQVRDQLDTFEELRRLWILFDLTAAVVKGVIKDNLITRGLDVINDLDFKDWVAQYCFTPRLTAWSPPVQAMYKLIFCGHNHHTFEAGTCLRCIFRVALDYKGAFYYRMQAGMGDAIFTPVYEVLKKRGVKFKFFHKIKNLGLNPEKTRIETIRIAKQVTLKSGEYQPLYTVKKLPCWPSFPDYEQIEEGRELKEKGIDLENSWSGWEDVSEFTLNRGNDFDVVLLGISLAALPFVAKELIEAKPEWKKMVENVVTTPTRAFQAWFRPDIAGLGWLFSKDGMPMVGNYSGVFDTWCDLSNLIPKENWPANEYPGNISYFCGMLEDEPIPPFDQKDYPEKGWRELKTMFLNL
jgi:uncharacterized protein with NAD-binding domain and iron-sulfur cluster